MSYADSQLVIAEFSPYGAGRKGTRVWWKFRMLWRGTEMRQSNKLRCWKWETHSSGLLMVKAVISCTLNWYSSQFGVILLQWRWKFFFSVVENFAYVRMFVNYPNKLMTGMGWLDCVKGFPKVPNWFRKLFPYSDWGAELNARITPLFFSWLVGPCEVNLQKTC
jgi:hypothetical protein